MYREDNNKYEILGVLKIFIQFRRINVRDNTKLEMK